MAVDDAVDLVGALRRLVDALREAGDRVWRRGEQSEETQDVGFFEPGDFGCCCRPGRNLAGARKRFGQSRGMGIDIAVVEGVRISEIHEQPAKQRRIHAGRDRQE